MQKIAADKVSIMECDPESTSVIIHWFFFQNLTQHIITHWPWNFEKNLWSGRVYIKLSTKGVKKNIVILNVIIFCAQTKVFGNIKFCCLIVTSFVSLTAIFFQQFFSKQRKYGKFFKSISWMSFVNFQSLTPFSQKQRGNKTCAVSKYVYYPYANTYEKLSRYVRFC